MADIKYIKYTKALSNWVVQSLAPHDFMQMQRDLWGQPTFNVCEYLTADTMVKVYTDRDRYCDEEPSQELLQQERQECINRLAAMFYADPRFDVSHIHIAYRHGQVSKADGTKWKISFRCYVQGFKIRVGSIPDMIRACQSEEHATEDFWDMSPYKSKQLLAVPGGCKGSQDHRVLELEDPAALPHCVVQNLLGDEVLLDMEEFSSDKTQLRQDVTAMQLSKRSLTSPAWDEVQPLLEQAGFKGLVYMGDRKHSLTFRCDRSRPCACCLYQHDSQNWWVMGPEEDGRFKVKSYSDRCKMLMVGQAVYEHVQDITPITVHTPPTDALNISLNQMGFPNVPGVCFTLQQHLETCPTCRSHHSYDSPYTINTVVQHCFTVRNVDPICKDRIVDIPTMVEQPGILKRIFDNPYTDAPLADLYVAEKGQNLVEVDDVVYSFSDNHWQAMDHEDLDQDVKAFLAKILQGLTNMLLHEEYMIQFDSSKQERKKLRELRDKLQTAIKFVEQVGRRSQVLKGIKNQIHDSKLRGKWDSSPMTLGVDNGLIDLETGDFRQALKEDYVTMSTRYSWPDAWNPVTEQSFLEFMQQVYPVEEELMLFQQWMGYSITGRHNEKYLLLLTDRYGCCCFVPVCTGLSDQ